MLTKMWLSGWDNLHPEFNFKLNFWRGIFSVWQEYQGLGTVGGLGYGADLPRMVWLWLLSGVFPEWSLRWVTTVLMLAVGTVGAYLLMKKLTGRKVAALLGAAFYLLNLNTLQVFWVPFESFVWHWAFLPWLIWVFWRTREKMTKRRLVLFFILNLLAVPQAYVTTIFVVYFMILAILSLGEMRLWRKSLVLIALVFVTNAFWLLPFGYFMTKNIQAPVDSHMNKMSTENIFLQNKKFSGPEDVLRLKGFLFDYVDIKSDGNYGYLLGVWREWLERPEIKVVSYILVGIAAWGTIKLLRQKNRYRWVWLGLLLVPLGVMTGVIDWLRAVVPLLSQVFRVPFTKFGTMMALAMSGLFAWGVRRAGKVIVVIGLGLVVVLMWPAFGGKIIYNRLNVEIPDSYFETMKYLNVKGREGRIAVLPQPTYWGWLQYSWGYRGSGFDWYGFNNPLLVRAHDGYSSENENYYWQLSRAVYSEDEVALRDVLKKYGVRWVMVDRQISVSGSGKALYVDKIEEMLGVMPEVEEVQSFGAISIYEIKDWPGEIWTIDGVAKIGPNADWLNRDQAFVDWGDYVEGSEVVYPFRTMFTGRSQDELGFSIERRGGDLVFKSRLVDGYEYVATESATILDNKAISSWSVDSGSCDEFNRGEIEQKIGGNFGGDELYLWSRSSSNCVIASLPDLMQRNAYLLEIESEHIGGKPLLFRVTNMTTKHVELETQLPKKTGWTKSYFVIPSTNPFGLGYELLWDNISIGRVETSNQLGRLSVYQIPLEKMEGQIMGKGQNKESRRIRIREVKHPNPSRYKVKLSEVKSGDVLVLSQAYDDGWVALGLPGHVKVNGWQNGWVLNGGEEEVTIFYWPQILEFIGFGILVLGGIWLGVSNFRATKGLLT